MSKEKPILFSTEMVKAILDGRKKMTRRVVKVANPDEWEPTNDCRNSKYGATVPCYISRKVATEERGVYYPRYDVGDILWVKETWNDISTKPHIAHTYTYRADWASDYVQNSGPWKSSRSMPRKAARIFLRVTNVRVERLQDITEDQIFKEGTPYTQEDYDSWKNSDAVCRDRNAFAYMRGCFKNLWDSLNKKRGYGWDTNPWVWVYEFERVVKVNE